MKVIGRRTRRKTSTNVMARRRRASTVHNNQKEQDSFVTEDMDMKSGEEDNKYDEDRQTQQSKRGILRSQKSSGQYKEDDAGLDDNNNGEAKGYKNYEYYGSNMDGDGDYQAEEYHEADGGLG